MILNKCVSLSNYDKHRPLYRPTSIVAKVIAKDTVQNRNKGNLLI